MKAGFQLRDFIQSYKWCSLLQMLRKSFVFGMTDWQRTICNRELVGDNMISEFTTIEKTVFIFVYL